MRRAPASVLPALVALLAVLALVPAAGATTPTNRVVGGVDATSTDAPWQALVEPSGYLCGGSILDATHVVTAAHCVYDDTSYEVFAPTSISVTVGTTHLDGSGGVVHAVDAVSIDRDYDPYSSTGDAAILTLSSPIAFDGTTVAPIGLTDVGWRPLDGVTHLQLSGWGLTAARAPWDDPAPTDQPAADLQVITDILSTSTCSGVYGPDYDDSLQLCAGAANHDACQGDSGGPLAVDDHGWRLAGIVTGGAGCGYAGYPGIYARVSAPGIHDFLATRGAGTSLEGPYFTRRPAVSGDAVPYQTLTCDPGAAANAYDYESTWVINGRAVSYATTLRLVPGDVGSEVSCVSVAYGLLGSVSAQSQALTVHWPPAAPPTTTTTTTTPSGPGTVTPAADTAAPTSKVLRTHCTHTTCTLDVRVDDAAPTRGVRGIEAWVKTTYRSTCTVKVKGKRRRRPCGRVETTKLTAVRTEAANTYRITARRLRKGRHTFTLVAVDVAGHRQAKPTTFTRTTA